jgi:ornithine carbamoyltransferase
MAQHASIPVINGLSDHEHPCQALADFLTLQEHFGDLRKVKLAYVGDGNNVAHSLMLAAAATGAAISVATPAAYEPDEMVTAAARSLAGTTGAHIELTQSPADAAAGADAIYTDVWASMGQEDEAEERRATFADFQVDEVMMQAAAPNALFMHCLPAHRGDEVTAGVIDSPRSVVFEQAENRLHVQKAILLMLLAGGPYRFAPRGVNV